MSHGDPNKTDYIPLDRHIKSISRYYLGTLAAVIVIVLIIYAAMQVVLERHSVQQSISFLTSNQFIQFQQLKGTARALMRGATNEVVPDNVLNHMIDDLNQQIAGIRDTGARLHRLRLQLDKDARPSDLDLRLAAFIERAEKLGKFSNDSRSRHYSFWGPIDFAAASDGAIMRGFQLEVAQSFDKSQDSIVAAKRISALLILSLLAALCLVGALVILPLLRKLRTENDKKEAFERELSVLVHKDSLTGLCNRRSFNQQLERLVQPRHADGGQPASAPFALLLIDLDDFKAVNDTFGHQTGDRLLIEAARRITSSLAAGAIAARLGGDEFAVLAPGVADNAAAEALVARLRALLVVPFAFEGHTHRICASIGGAIFPEHGADGKALIRCADLALYAAKVERNSEVMFNAALMADRLAESRLRAELYQAVEAGEFLVYYQPKIDIRTGRHLAFEALVRWRHPQLGILPPGRFLHLLDTAPLMTAMTEIVVNRVAADIRGWRDAGLEFGSVAINMPETALISDAGYGMLSGAVQRHAIEWSDLAIEITEDVFVNKYAQQILATVLKLRERGVSIALDDFGTGFASLTNLRNFHFDDIKIDRSFVSEIGKEVKSEQIIKAMINLAANLGKRCVAEGVETEEQVLFLRQAGCVIAQGYFYAQPQPFEAATPSLASALAIS
ncbi:diguanylate cyclase (GGDEF)-like protein [Duganella sp. SG902]|uniref:putative bifunctional diguanylate cyclase/phosphodiesterase n=1 Tax=Duganella sp. SG902 TaxID=2587016 RepID=UPI00159EB611|nr:EAL domain-containing protein [Duganella sp. SG902]NVM77546.1 diguanylate cyclase (GGDEF)-like protein [Duganella sp. SG902]